MNEYQRLDLLLEQYIKDGVQYDAKATLKARVKLGIASWSERIRYYLGLGPDKEAIAGAKRHRDIADTLAEMKKEAQKP